MEKPKGEMLLKSKTFYATITWKIAWGNDLRAPLFPKRCFPLCPSGGHSNRLLFAARIRAACNKE